jgi:hypothetical protein
MRKLLLALAAACALGGCMKIDKAPPKDLPAFVKLYPGATGTMSMSMGPMSSILFQTTASPDDVVSYYRGQASADGLTEQPAKAQTGSPAEQRQAEFRDATGGEILVVVAWPQQNTTMVDLTYSNQPKAAS